MRQKDLVIIGGGPAGMAAAVAAYDAGVTDVVILDREPELGGILQQCIHAGFGLHKLGQELTGPEYAQVYRQQVQQRNIPVYREATVTALSPDKVVTAQSREGILKFQARAVVLATGCRERSRGALSIPGTRPAGVYSAGTAQKLINCMGCQVGKEVVILGSGDIGLIMARRMTLQGAHVQAVCELMPYSGGLVRNLVQCLEDFEIPLYLSTTVCQIHGRERLEGVTIAQVDEHRQVLEHTRRYIPCDTLLLSVGLIPENELARGAGVPMDPVTGGALVDQDCQTGIPGIFACGNALQVHDLVDYVSEEAERAGIGAARYLRQGSPVGTPLSTRAGSGVRYVLPQQVYPGSGEISLFLRVAQPQEKVRLVVRSGEQVLGSFRRALVAPGSMEKLTLDGALLESLQEPITVSLEVTQ